MAENWHFLSLFGGFIGTWFLFNGTGTSLDANLSMGRVAAYVLMWYVAGFASLVVWKHAVPHADIHTVRYSLEFAGAALKTFAGQFWGSVMGALVVACVAMTRQNKIEIA